MPVLGAALLAVPTVLLYFSDLGSTAGTVAVALSWLIWAVFLVEAVIMLSVVAQRRAWMRGHLVGLAILIATFPLLTARDRGSHAPSPERDPAAAARSSMTRSTRP